MLLLVSSLLLLGSGQTVFEFTEAGQQKKYQLEASEVHVTLAPGMSAGKEMRRTGARTYVVKLEGGKTAARAAGYRETAPVLYDVAELRAGKTQQRRDAARRIMTAKLHVRMGAEAALWSKLQELGAVTKKESLVKGWMVVEFGDAWAAWDATQRLWKDGGVEFVPLFAQARYGRQFSGPLQRTVNDPLYARQWNLANSNVNINLRGSWDAVTGRGINVTVVDDGLEVAHPDLKDNVHPLASNYHFNFNSGPDEDPTPLDVAQSHGTSCAGIVAARGFNNEGVIGVAPEAKMIGLRLIAEPSEDDASAAAFGWEPAGVQVHVSSNSWGPADDGADAGRASALIQAGQEKAATKNRNGLGTVLVISAGNGRQEGDDSSYDAYSSSRYAIAVGAVNQKGEPSSYSERGVNVSISAPGGEMAPPEMIWTTNVSGPEAFAKLKEGQETSTAPVNYTDAFNGTSAAAPHVSGAVALLLQRYPGLGYRDVKEILMRSARREMLTGGDGFVTNAGGFSFSHNFGAGLLNVAGALELAAGWQNLPAVVSASVTRQGINEEIPDGTTEGVTATFDFASESNLRVEHVEFTVTVEHAMRGQLAFQITSPSGMRSLVLPREKDETENFVNYTFTSVRHWGESSQGQWKLTVADLEDGEEGELKAATIRVFGTPK